MKWIRAISCFIPFLQLLFAMTSFAKDTDIYMASGEGVEPNILIIFDNSESMDQSIDTRQYVKTEIYEGSALPDKVYRLSSGNWILFGATADLSDIADIPAACTTARNALTDYNFATGVYTALDWRGRCNQNRRDLRTGNYVNYMASGGNQSRQKIVIARETINQLLDTVGDVKVGLMVFNPNVGDGSLHGGGWGNSHGGSITSAVKSLTTVEPDIDTGLPSTYKENLKKYIDRIQTNAFTPLAESLYEAGVYFKGGVNPPTDNHGYFNTTHTYTSPIEYNCQKSYVILMTDGDPTRDDGYRPGDSCSGEGTDPEAHHHVFWTVIGDRDGDGKEPLCRTVDTGCSNPDRVHYIVMGSDMLGTDYLDDVAKYLHETDLRPDLTGTQNITTYTVGFAVEPQHNLLGRAADSDHGGGAYYTASDAAELANAFQHIVGEILEQTTSFVAPIVPVSRMEKETAGDKLYLALFQPNNDVTWSGNIKKFGVVQSGVNLGQVIDGNDIAALDGDGKILDSSTSYWSTGVPDGSDVEKGGVGGVLKARVSGRDIYTYQYSVDLLSDDSNAFDTTHITAAMLGVATDTDRDNLVNFIHGLDAYDEDGDGNTITEKRSWFLGAFLHSRPLIIHYPDFSDPEQSKTYIFAGSNDGMLHAFDDSDGSEAWAFIPPDMLGNLNALRADVHAVFVDGSPKAYIEYDAGGEVSKAILIFGERRGGSRYYALDVTTPTSPKYLWEINPTGRVYQTTPHPSSDYEKLGQSWSSPSIGKVACVAGTTNCVGGVRWVAFIGGGYDTNQDNNPVIASDTVGMAVYVIDVLDGSLVKRFSVTEYADMAYSIPSDVAKVDTNGNGIVDRLYVGDLGGQMWRFDVYDANPANWTARIVFKSNPGSSDHRKIFYPPDVTLEKGGYEMLLFGTGDREHPAGEGVLDRLYTIKDKSSIEAMPILDEEDLVDVTTDELQAEGTTGEEKAEILSGLESSYGWFIILDLFLGEKCLASPVVFYGAAYFTTFSPTATGNPCDAGFGAARMYVVDYTNGNAVFNFDLTNDIGEEAILRRSDRIRKIGTAIPSGVIVTVIQGKVVAYTGVGGGVDMPTLPSTKSLVPTYWRIVF